MSAVLEKVLRPPVTERELTRVERRTALSGIVYVTQIPSRLDNGVYIPTVDISPAKEYGALHVLTPSGMNFSRLDDPLLEAFSVLRARFDPSEDYYLPMGDPLLMTLGASILGTIARSFRTLKWDRHTRKYRAYEVIVARR